VPGQDARVSREALGREGAGQGPETAAAIEDQPVRAFAPGVAGWQSLGGVGALRLGRWAVGRLPSSREPEVAPDVRASGGCFVRTRPRFYPWRRPRWAGCDLRHGNERRVAASVRATGNPLQRGTR
jgi:hypothetical protein